ASGFGLPLFRIPDPECRMPNPGQRLTTIKQKGPPRCAEGHVKCVEKLSIRHDFWGLGLSGNQRLYMAMVTTVSEVDHQADGQPDDESCPVDPSQLVHHVAVGENSYNRHKCHPGHAECPSLSWVGPPQ